MVANSWQIAQKLRSNISIFLSFVNKPNSILHHWHFKWYSTIIIDIAISNFFPQDQTYRAFLTLLCLSITWTVRLVGVIPIFTATPVISECVANVEINTWNIQIMPNTTYADTRTGNSCFLPFHVKFTPSIRWSYAAKNANKRSVLYVQRKNMRVTAFWILKKCTPRNTKHALRKFGEFAMNFF